MLWRRNCGLLQRPLGDIGTVDREAQSAIPNISIHGFPCRAVGQEPDAEQRPVETIPVSVEHAGDVNDSLPHTVRYSPHHGGEKPTNDTRFVLGVMDAESANGNDATDALSLHHRQDTLVSRNEDGCRC